jgi:serine protease inhibitor
MNILGTEAAAATAVVMCDVMACISKKSTPIEFKVDRPFLFTIQESRQGITLFQGKYLSSK